MIRDFLVWGGGGGRGGVIYGGNSYVSKEVPS